MNSTSLPLSFGQTAFPLDLSMVNLMGVFRPQRNGPAGLETDLLRKALARPIETPPLRDLVRRGQQVVIVISDLTRPCPSDRLLPPVLAELAEAGLPEENVTIVVALGLHRPMTPAELEAAVGPEIYRRVRVINHDPTDTVSLGHTAIGTPVQFFRPVVEADLRICLSNLEFHYFAGYSGGAKSILPGCAAEATIQANHSLMVLPGARAGHLEGNPVRTDIEDGVARVGVDFILNVIVDGRHRLVEVVAGEVTAAHRHGCRLVKQRGTVPIPEQADIVLVSAGGYPKDVNLYQAQKALDNAIYAVRPGGIVILVAECREGLGNQTFEAWMGAAQSPDDLLKRIQEEFVLGGHKAAAIGMAMKRASIYLVSALPADFAQTMGFYPFDSLDKALQTALSQAGKGATVAVLPEGGSVLPIVESQ